jgi:hypothetical protein
MEDDRRGPGVASNLMTFVPSVVLVLLVLLVVMYFWHADQDERRERAVRVFETQYTVFLKRTDEDFADRWNRYCSIYYEDCHTPNRAVYSGFVQDFLQQPQNRDAYEALTSFYETLGDCVSRELCSRWEARHRFGFQAKYFYRVMEPQIKRDYETGRGYDGLLTLIEDRPDDGKDPAGESDPAGGFYGR